MIWLEDIAVHCLKGTAAADFRREQVGFVFQLFYLLPNLSALENVMAPLLPYRRKFRFDLKRRALQLLEQVGLGDRQGHPPARLSGGEQQRVAIARALVNRPKIVLADEPTGNLDPATGEEVLEVLRELQREGKQTLIMVTHDPQLAALADRRIAVGTVTAGKETSVMRGSELFCQLNTRRGWITARGARPADARIPLLGEPTWSQVPEARGASSVRVQPGRAG